MPAGVRESDETRVGLGKEKRRRNQITLVYGALTNARQGGRCLTDKVSTLRQTAKAGAITRRNHMLPPVTRTRVMYPVRPRGEHL